VADARVTYESLFDYVWGYLFSSPIYKLFKPTREEEVTILVDPTLVPGTKPFTIVVVDPCPGVGVHLNACSRLVLPDHAWARHTNFPFFPGR